VLKTELVLVWLQEDASKSEAGVASTKSRDIEKPEEGRDEPADPVGEGVKPEDDLVGYPLFEHRPARMGHWVH